MPTQLPRVNVTVTPEQHALLMELAASGGFSAAGFLRLVLDAATPFLREAVPAIRDAYEDEYPDLDNELRDVFQAIFYELRDNRFADQLAFDAFDDPISISAAANDARACAARSERGRESDHPAKSPAT